MDECGVFSSLQSQERKEATFSYDNKFEGKFVQKSSKSIVAVANLVLTLLIVLI